MSLSMRFLSSFRPRLLGARHLSCLHQEALVLRCDPGRPFPYLPGPAHQLSPLAAASQCRRFSKKSKSRRDEKATASDDEEDEDKVTQEPEDVVKTGYSDVVISCTALRVDAVAKAGMNLPRSVMDEGFMEGRLRLNGFKVLRKGEWVKESDLVDFIQGRNHENQECLDVFRLEIRSIPDMPETGKIKVKVRRYKKLMVPNYENDPWNGVALSE